MIGIKAVVFGGALIGEGSIIGMNATVLENTKIPPRSVAVGTSAKVIKSVDDAAFQVLKEHALHYYHLAMSHKDTIFQAPDVYFRRRQAMKEYIQVFTTTEKKEEAEKIAQVLVTERLAACAQIVGPISSIYHWKGRVENAQEWLCIIKTKGDLYDKLEKAIRDIHSYETPEIIAIPIIAGSKDYLKWLEKEVKK